MKQKCYLCPRKFEPDDMVGVRFSDEDPYCKEICSDCAEDIQNGIDPATGNKAAWVRDCVISLPTDCDKCGARMRWTQSPDKYSSGYSCHNPKCPANLTS